jgi:hypothetical protein
MSQIVLTHSFVSGIGQLDQRAVHQTASFLERLVIDPQTAVLQAEVIGSTDDRSILALFVEDDLRTIAHDDGRQLMLLFAGRYNVAYEWAYANCLGTELPRAGRRINPDEIPTPAVPGLPSAQFTDAWNCPLNGSYDLTRALEALGIGHSSLY